MKFRLLSYSIAALSLFGAVAVNAQLRSIQISHNDADTLKQMQKFARCVAKAKPRAVAAALARDPNDPSFHETLRHLSQERPTCLPLGGIMAFNNFAIASSMAEYMVLRDHPEDRITRGVALSTAAPLVTRDELERFSLCAVRAAPVQAVAVLRSEIASQAEMSAMKDMSDVFVGCVGPIGAVRFGKPTLRSGIAMAAYRLTTSNVTGSN